MGTVYQSVIVRNTSAAPCRLSTLPVLYYDTPAGARQPVPATYDIPTQAPVLLAPGRYARFMVATVNGNPYGPSASQCASPADYKGLSVVLSGSVLFPGAELMLPGFEVSLQCDGVRVRPWQRTTDPTVNGVNPTRAPPPTN